METCKIAFCGVLAVIVKWGFAERAMTLHSRTVSKSPDRLAAELGGTYAFG